MSIDHLGKHTLTPRTLRMVRDTVVNPRKDKKNSKREKEKKNVVRGTEVTIRESSSEAQVIYGRMRVGGVATFVDTSQDSNAYLITGEEGDENQLVWTAKTAGASGNNIEIWIECTGTFASIFVNVLFSTTTIIYVRVASNSGNSLNTMAQVIAAIQANATANTLVRVQKLDANKNGLVDAVAQTPLSYGGGKWLHQMITIAGHQIDAIETLYLDNQAVTFGASPDARWGTGRWTNRVFMAVQPGTYDQAAQPDLIGQLPTKWTTDHRQRGCAGAYLITVWDQNVFKGNPEVSFLVRGKLVYDPRTAQTVWTRNAALIVADFLADSIYGFGIPYADIDTAALEDAADICDEAVSLAGGGTEARYCIDGSFDSSQSREETLAQLLEAMDGELVIQGSKRFIFAGAYIAPTITLTEDDLRDTITISTHQPRSETFNCIKGTYSSPSDNYQETDIPPVKNSTYITEDGSVERWKDMALNFVTQSCQAQRLLKIALERNRQGVTVYFPAQISALRVAAGRTVNISLSQYGYTPKIFKVVETAYVISDEGWAGIDLVLRETASGIHDWNSGLETTIDLADNTSLPDPTDVDEPTGLTLTSGTSELYVRNDGTVQTRLKVSWTPSASPYVEFGGKYEIQFKRSADSVWSQSYAVTGETSFHYILDVEDGVNYDVRIRAVNTLGFYSDWVTSSNHTVVGKTERPSDVTGLTASVSGFGVLLTWNHISDIDRDEYEVRVGASWGAGTVIYRGKANAFTWDYKTAGSYTFRIRAYDTSRNESLNEATTGITISAPGTPTVTSVFDGANTILSWTEPSSQFAIREYEIRYGASYAAGTVVAVITGRNLTIQVTWGGTRTFWVAARDIASNTGTAGTTDITIVDPNPPVGFVSSAVRNNVLLDWKDPVASTLPVAKFHVYKGDTFASAIKLGTVFGTFHTYVERTGGNFTYWVETEDTAGNISTNVSSALTVSAPQDFYIRDTQELIPSLFRKSLCIVGGTSEAEYEDPTAIWLPVGRVGNLATLPLIFNTISSGYTETFGDWFDNNGWSTLQDAIDAGFDPWLDPSPTTPGYVEFKVDYGVEFASSFINFYWTEVSLDEAVTVIPSIFTSADDVTYTEYANSNQVFAENFRYVIYRFDFYGSSQKALSRLESIYAEISLEQQEEEGVAAVLDTDVDGTEVLFTLDFLDVQDIQLTGQGTDFGNAVANFVDIPNPTGMKILYYDSDGNRISGNVRYRVKGAVNPT